MIISYNETNKKELKIDDVLVLKAADGEGEAILAELVKFSENEQPYSPKKMHYIAKQKAWFNTEKNKIVLFCIATNEKDIDKANTLISDYLSSKKSISYSTTTGGIVTTDKGVALATDTGKALQIHESREKNISKK